MATRLYFRTTYTRLTANPSIQGSWNRTTEDKLRDLSLTKETGIFSGQGCWDGVTSPAANLTALACRFVSPRMPAGIVFGIADTIKGVGFMAEGAIDDNINRQPFAVYIYNSADVLASNLLNVGHRGPATTEWSTTGQSRQFAIGNGFSGAPYTTSAGDYIVIEVGGQVSALGGTSVAGAIYAGTTTGNDLPENETTTTQDAGWFEFSNTITFLTEDQGKGGTRFIAVGIDQPAHPGGVASYRTAMPQPTPSQLSGRAAVVRGADQPPHEGGLWSRVGRPDVAQGQLPGRANVVRGEDLLVERGREAGAVGVGLGAVVVVIPPELPSGPPPPTQQARGEDRPPEPGRLTRGTQALIPNPPSQRPGRFLQTYTEPPPADGRAWHQPSPFGPAARGQPRGTVTVARGPDFPPEPGRTGAVLRPVERAPVPGQVTVRRGEDARPAEGLAMRANRSRGIPPGAATRPVITPADEHPHEPGRLTFSPRPPAAPPPVVPPPPLLAYGWGAQPEVGRGRVLGAVGLVNPFPPRPTIARGQGADPEPGSGRIGRPATAPRTPAVKPGRAWTAASEFPLSEFAAGRVWWTTPRELESGRAGHVCRWRASHVTHELPVRVYRDKQARIARWPL